MRALQECNNITKNGTYNKRSDARGFGQQHRSEFQTDPNGWLPPTKFKTARKAFDEIGVLIFKIPPRSPDLNPIENFFNLVVTKLRKEVLDEKIESETYDEFRQ